MSGSTIQGFRFNEEYLSQIPALQELIALGYDYLSPEKALEFRGGKTSNVLLESVLREQLQKFNRIRYRGEEFYFSDANIQEAIQKIKNVQYVGLQKTNEAIYDLITLGTAMEQKVEGNTKSFSLNYIDWKTLSNNVFHVVPEFTVERNRSVETARPDIVLFVNGIPLAVIECKSPKVEVEQAISQSIRNQGDEYIPKLFTYVQLVMGINKNAARYATAGTPAKFQGVWDELEDKEEKITQIINTPLSDEKKNALFSGDFASARNFFDTKESAGERELTEQDKAIYSLCRPERLLELTYYFTLFEAGTKKIARYPQFFVVRSILARIQSRYDEVKRTGGIVWQTQGSGKSLTMVMLARAIALDPQIINPQIVLVTDRDDLDKQLGNTFAACGLSKERATSGRNLVKHLQEKVGIITTLIHKFEKGREAEKYIDESPDIFVLVDESHRTNFGSLAGAMRKMLPNACYLGFTGTPLLKKDKNNFAKFGGLIQPHYSIRQAVEDGVVLPLLYESRHVEMDQNQVSIDIWFDRHTSDLNQRQKADLKKKYARAEMLNKSDRVIYMRAFDISEHYRANWQGTGFKAQLVAPGKAAALKYHECLKEIGFVNSEVIISAPDTREGHEEVNVGPTDEVGRFWDQMMKRFGSEEEYTKQIIHGFKHGEEPEILIVVDKLLTGFDAPKNAVLYFCRALREHTLLQAIARVNRLYEGKDFGFIIDYVSMLGELDKAMIMYDAFAGFEEKDLLGTLTPVDEEVKRLSQYHSDLWDVFRDVKNRQDEEAFEVLLADKKLREDFYERLSRYNKTLGIALSTGKFLTETEETQLKAYKGDLKRFMNLRKSVRLRYDEAIDYGDYEPKIKKLLDTYIQADEVIQLNKPVNIFDNQSFDAVKQGQGIHSTQSTAAKADTIAHATKRAVYEKMEEDPAFYEKFSKLIQQAIDDFKTHRISDSEYFSKVGDIRDKVVSKHREEVPEGIKNNDEACAYYDVIYSLINPGSQSDGSKTAEPESGENLFAAEPSAKYGSKSTDPTDISVRIAIQIQEILRRHKKIDFWSDDDAQKAAINDIDDFFYDEIKNKIALNPEQMDEIIEKTMQIAKNRRK